MMKVILDAASNTLSRDKQHDKCQQQAYIETNVDEGNDIASLPIKSHDEEAIKESYWTSIDNEGNRINLKKVLYGNDTTTDPELKPTISNENSTKKRGLQVFTTC